MPSKDVQNNFSQFLENYHIQEGYEKLSDSLLEVLNKDLPELKNINMHNVKTYLNDKLKGILLDEYIETNNIKKKYADKQEYKLY